MQKRIGIFGGSFDPPHKGHLAIIQNAIKQLDLEILFIVPSFLNPFKSAFHFSPNVRLWWLQELVKNIKSEKCVLKVLDFEVRQNAPTPTFKTLKYLLDSLNCDVRCFLLLGADNVESLPKWAEFAWLEKNVEFVIIPRNGYTIPKNYITLEFKEITISSTKLREMLELREYAKLKKWIPQTIVESVIKEANCKKTEKH
ncbi:nicotinate (nicotinamide) nucleotide adenylyltransferase [uncultured Helicobacter sp.]|uniref:nicotinate (nicotinamide) nucleotide adenylyltransferase n=1 Tax=uncultured Helicobacter sp. TaxID=175537 RepID=UPI002610B8C8|nr:nicotinate (nicotinamide) nucleotide adenylyltransferase [uncultured Helicobacter sp.]